MTVLVAAFVRFGTFERASVSLVGPVVSISAMAFGFLLTVTTLLLRMEESFPVVQELREIGAFDVLLNYLRSAIYAWGLLAIWTILVALVEPRLLDPLLNQPWLR